MSRLNRCVSFLDSGLIRRVESWWLQQPSAGFLKISSRVFLGRSKNLLLDKLPFWTVRAITGMWKTPQMTWWCSRRQNRSRWYSKYCMKTLHLKKTNKNDCLVSNLCQARGPCTLPSLFSVFPAQVVGGNWWERCTDPWNNSGAISQHASLSLRGGRQ